MRKKCVRWTKSVQTSLALAAVIATGMVMTPTAQSIAPSTLPRLEFKDVQYVGGFRLPNTSANGESFSFGGSQLAYNPARNSLFVGARGRVAEVSIPTIARSAN